MTVISHTFGDQPVTVLKTGQTTCYASGDDGDEETGVSSSLAIYDTDQYNGTTAIDCPHYAAATLAFVAATKKITDSAAGLVTVLTGDTIRIRGSASNDGVYTVATGGVAGEIVTTEALVDEGAARYITICKRESHSNNAVLDQRTGLMWSRYVSGAKVGPASDGKLAWYDATLCYTLHPAGADLSMTATTSTVKVVGGAGEVARYNAGYRLEFSGFASAANNLAGGYRVVSVTVNGADLDIVIDPINQTLVSEAAAGARAIKIVCQSIWSYLGAARAASLSGFTDWRVANFGKALSIHVAEAPLWAPDSTAFPSWPSGTVIHTSTTYPATTTSSFRVGYGYPGLVDKATSGYAILVRGG